jgi:hypothetical protein
MTLLFALAVFGSGRGLLKKFTGAHLIETLCLVAVFISHVALYFTQHSWVVRGFRYSLVASVVVYFVHRYVLTGKYAAAMAEREAAARATKERGAAAAVAQK